MDFGDMEIVERCGICGCGIVGLVNVSSGRRKIHLTCNCESSAEVDEFEDHMRAFKRMQRECYGGVLSDAGFKSDDGRNPQVTEACKNYVDNFAYIQNREQNGLVLCGSPGTGKTFMAEAIVNTMMWRWHTACFDTAAGMISDFQHGTRDRVNRLKVASEVCSLFVIDDFGSQANTSFRNEIIFSLVNNRYRAKKPLIITTNIPFNEMVAPSSVEEERLYRRIVERCKVVNF